jgi:hypothetical protein
MICSFLSVHLRRGPKTSFLLRCAGLVTGLAGIFSCASPQPRETRHPPHARSAETSRAYVTGFGGEEVCGLRVPSRERIRCIRAGPTPLDYLATGLPRQGDVVERQRYLDDASGWSLSLLVVLPLAPLQR